MSEWDNELVSRPSWVKRNWKWALPLGGCLGLIFVFVLMIGSIFYGVTTLFEDSDPYEYAFEKINQDEQLIKVLGSPIEKDGMAQGSLNYTNGDGKADMIIPISGPKGKGTLYIHATSSDDDWTYHEIRVDITDEESFQLLENDPLEQF